MVALGERTAGLMGNHEGWMDQVRRAADAAGEPVWPLPLPDYLRGKLDSELADLKNITDTRYGVRWRPASSCGSSWVMASPGRTSTSPARLTPRWWRGSW